MAPEMKWNPKAELDLCVAILLGNQEGERIRPNWTKVTSIMEGLGYEFSKDAMAQHYGKHVMRDFKARCEAFSPSAAADDAAADTNADTSADAAAEPPATPKAEKPKKAATPRKKGTATPVKDGSASAKRRRSTKKTATADEGADDAADGGSAKKTKIEDNAAETPIKAKNRPQIPVQPKDLDAAVDAEDKTDGEDIGDGVKMEAAAAA